MAADERRSKAIKSFFEAYAEYSQLDKVRYHTRVEISGDTLVEIHRYYGGRKGRCVLRVMQKEEEQAVVPAEVAAYEQAADQLLDMVKDRRESLEENRRRSLEALRNLA